MEKKHIRSVIGNYLSQKEDIVFAYLFGSFISSDRYRDIDTAIYTSGKPELLRIGMFSTELEERIGQQVELIQLNDLPNKHPAFAYEIVTKGELLFTHHPELHIDYKRTAFLYYFDTAHLRRSVDRAFDRRLESDRFGERD